MNRPTPSGLTVPQQLLWEAASAVLLSGRIAAGRVKIPFSPALRLLWDVPRSLRGGPLLNARVHADDRENVARALRKLVDEGAAVDLHYRIMQPGTRQERRLHLLLKPLPTAPERVAGVLRDDSLLEADERERVLIQERLQSVSRLTLLGEVASGLAHELNQPLAAITTFAQAGERMLAMPTPRLDRVQQICADVSQQALRAGEIIQRMRNLIRRHDGQRSVVQCQGLLSEFVSIAEPMARASHVALRSRIEDGALRVDVDSVQILQVLMNLFQNAMEAARAHSRAPEVAVESRRVDGGVEIAIVDSGAGVSKEVAAQLFRPFFSTKSNGTGLGLIGCRKILEGYGSRLEFTNVPAGGCRFFFVLPAVDT